MAPLIEWGVSEGQKIQGIADSMAPTARIAVPTGGSKKDVQTKAYHLRASEWCRSFILPYAASLSFNPTTHAHLRLPVWQEEKPGGGDSIPPGGNCEDK
ncbi:hypothetical protein [Roseibium aggregatum]|uniref:Uncharacterized protein n=1 Tax=Roseibium aggregatum TaxID=187304 RepID=A0A926NY14_9HYPH|nr:hypothetical protein [Roseibium aggregatum]MBD1549492.1 hypothetical protein [Roseibium aggregatum]